MSCPHWDAVPVESGGERVAALCPECDTQLPESWPIATAPVPRLPPFVPDPRLTRRISE